MKETMPIMDVKTEGLISERAVYGHWESEVVNMRYFVMEKNVTPLTTKPARIFNELSDIGSAFTISPVPSTSSLAPACWPPVACSVCMSLSSTMVGVVGVFLIGVGLFVVAGGMITADDAVSFNFSLFLLLFDFCLVEGGPSDASLQSRASEGPLEGRAALRSDGCCLDVDGTGIGGIAE